MSTQVPARLDTLEDRSAIRATPHLAAASLHAAALALCLACWFSGLEPVAVLLWPVLVWLSHAALSRLHEAVHGMLFRSRTANELAGIAIGTLALTPMSVYRTMHARHHAHLGGVADPEFWPYNLPGTARWLRRTYAWLELCAGAVVTPALYSLRTARAWPTLPSELRSRLVLEWLLLAASIGAVLAVTSRYALWEALLVGHVVPAWLTGSLQSVRKFTEHLGRFGDSIEGMTRTVVYRGRLGRLLSASQRFVDHHGTHHRFPAVPSARLPAATAKVQDLLPEAPFYRSHLAALREALPHLADPRLGPQWSEPPQPAISRSGTS